MAPRVATNAAKRVNESKEAEYQSLADLIGTQKNLALLLSHTKHLDLTNFQHSDAVYEAYAEILVIKSLGSLTTVINQAPFMANTPMDFPGRSTHAPFTFDANQPYDSAGRRVQHGDQWFSVSVALGIYMQYIRNLLMELAATCYQ